VNAQVEVEGSHCECSPTILKLEDFCRSYGPVGRHLV